MRVWVFTNGGNLFYYGFYMYLHLYHQTSEKTNSADLAVGSLLVWRIYKITYNLMAWQLQSSVNGKIMRLLMVDEDMNADSFKILVLSLYNSKPTHTQLVILSITKERKDELEALLKRQVAAISISYDVNIVDPNIVIILFPQKDRFEVNRWARDPFLVLQEDSASSDVSEINDYVPSSCGSYQSILAIQLSNFKIIKDDIKSDNWFAFEGGNVLKAGAYVLIGGGAFDEMSNRLRTTIPNMTIEEALSKLAILFNCDSSKLFPILTLAQRVGNLNKATDEHFFIAANGGIADQRVVNLNKATNEQLAQHQFFYNPVNWFSSPSIDNTKASIGDPFVHIDLYLTMTGVESNTPERKPILILASLEDEDSSHDKNTIKELNDNLDKIEQILSKAFFILRNKIPCIDVDSNDNNKWVFLFYNNCLVENSGEYKCVWLPSYLSSAVEGTKQWQTIKKYQACNEQIWRALGFQVLFIEADFVPYSKEKGSLHCLTKELVRQ